MSKHLDISITGVQGSNKTAVFKTLTQGFKKLGYTIVSLHPIPSLGQEDRALVYTEDLIINLYTQQKEVSNG